MPKTVFTDGDKSQGIPGTRVLAAFVNAIFSHRHDGLDQDGSAPLDYAVDTGAANAYVIAMTPALTAHITGFPLFVKITNANTVNNPTLKVDALAPVVITRDSGAALNAGDLPAGHMAIFVYNGTGYTLINPATMASPKIPTGDYIQESGGTKFLEFIKSATPVNWLRAESANTGTGPKLSAQGSDGSVDLQLEAKGAGKVKFVSGCLGAWETKSNNTVYQAATDGFIMGWANGGGYNGAVNDVAIYSDGSNPPTTIRCRSVDIQEGSAGHTSFGIAPIRKGDYYKITIGGSGASVGGIFWIPLG